MTEPAHTRFAALAVLGLLLGSCASPDEEAPSMEVLTISPEPRLGEICGQAEPNTLHVLSGDTILIQLRLSDNEGLSQLKIDLHSNSDCHGHAKLEATPWQMIDLIDLSGAEVEKLVSIPVPLDATAGPYHFYLHVLDKSGNEGVGEMFPVIVRNSADTIPPVLSVSQPSSPSLTLMKGATVGFAGILEDNTDLSAGGHAAVELRYWRYPSGNVFLLYGQAVPAGAGSAYAFSLSAVVPATLVSGEYRFELRGFDGVRNVSEPVLYSVTVQ